MKTKHRLAFLVLSILIIGLTSAHADTIQPMYTAIVNNLPGGGLEMINLSDGNYISRQVIRFMVMNRINPTHFMLSMQIRIKV